MAVVTRGASGGDSERHRAVARFSSPWLASLAFHLALLVAVSLVTTSVARYRPSLAFLASPDEPIEPELVREFAFSLDPTVEVGAGSVDGMAAAMGAAPVVAAATHLPVPELQQSDWGKIELPWEMLEPSGAHLDPEVHVRGVAGEGATGAEGAIDRLTQEILLSLEERDTLVVWLFDQSPSVSVQRAKLVERFQRIYDELGIVASSGHRAFAGRRDPLLSAIVAFGRQVTLVTGRPTDDVDELRRLVAGIPTDESGVEMAFTAIYSAALRFRRYRSIDGATGEPERNVLLIVFSDEVGDDQEGLEQTVKLCRRLAIPVYVVGVPATFGLRETLVKWIDPDPRYDQQVQWGRVNQGPESLLPERVVLPFAGTDEIRVPLDSGFGPFALSRLCYETGGIYFTVHPNRTVTRPVTRSDVSPYSAYLKVFFDPEVMRGYRPEYVSAKEYQRMLQEYPSRRALIEAAQATQLDRLENPRLRFVKRDEAQLAADLTEAQKDAAKLQPRIDQVFQILEAGEAHRDKEVAPRWQAGFDLALGTVAAVKVRTESYNGMLAMAKRGMPFQKPSNNTWVLVPDNQVAVGSRLENLAEKSRQLLEQVIEGHQGTPWAYLARRELQQPLGWKWTETYTELDPPSAPAPAGNNAPPQDQQLRMLERKPVRPVPRL